ncbi:MAG: diguanylate cyclase [Desulfobacteraceae bacterium]|nr:diguanylate cyclase [Desulfobacteraceae bacterium]
MKYQKFLYFLQNVGKDPSALVFEDELTGLYNRRYLLHYFKNRVSWHSPEKTPLCLLMIDADYMKRINDQYGHNAGDQAIIHIAGILRKAAPANAIPVRYSGDNFLLLLPERNRADARAIAEKVLHLSRKTGFSPPGTDAEIPLTVSIGIASAPEDASDGKSLIHRADTAMYQAKRSGRDQCADAGQLGRREFFPETLLRHLDAIGIAGRRQQLAQMSTELKKVAEGKSRFVIVEGEPGMGKTSFLTTIQENLEKTKLRPILVQGVIQEAFRPYYLASYVAMSLLNKLPARGINILEALNEDEIHRLSHIIPQLRGGSPPIPENDPKEREAIFSAFTRFLTRLAGSRPLVLLIDDFHYCDPASLHLFRMLMKTGELLIFICATASVEKHISGESVALDLFRNAYSEELKIQTITLPPLKETDIEKYLGMVFGPMELPKGLCLEMARVTQGNPLFLVEIIRKMINDEKIYRSEGKWSISGPGQDYFPKSLEEIVQARMENLDEESKQFLDRASAFGESTFLSMLAGITRDRDARIYNIITNAEEQGIVRTDFEENDENVRFSSKQIRDIIYNGISPEEKKLLHQQIGAYQERLYEQDLLPSASFLAHHFARSTDHKKANSYSEDQETRNSGIFDEKEIGFYTDGDREISERLKDEEKDPEQGLGDTLLSRQSMQIVPHLLRALLVAIRNTRLYPENSKSVTSAQKEVIKLLEKIFQKDGRISITAEENKILINGEQSTDPNLRWIHDKILELWDGMEIKSIIFKNNMEEKELGILLDELARSGGKTIGPGYWESFTRKQKLSGIEIRQVTYKKTTSGEKQSPAEPEAPLDTERADKPEEVEDLITDEDRLRKVRRLISTLLGTYGQLKLYPTGGPVAKRAVSRLAEKLHEYLSEERSITIARVGDSILVNGVRPDATGYEALFGGMVKILADAGLNSLTFSEQVSETDLKTFFEALLLTPKEKLDSEFWQKFAGTKQLSGVFFDRLVYDVDRLQPLAKEQKTEDRKEDESYAEKEKTGQKESRAAPEPADQNLAALLRDLYLEGRIKRLSAILSETAEKYISSNHDDRIEQLENFAKIIQPPDWQPTGQYIKLAAGLLVIPVFEAETETEKAGKAADILHEAAAKLILYGEYRPAATIFSRIRQHPHFQEKTRLETWDAPRVFGKKLDPRITDALVSDLKSAQQGRRQEACQLISTMGRGMTPLLLDIITSRQDLRTRRLAAELLGRMDRQAVDQAKQALITETMPEKKSRILEVIDSVTTNLKTELRYTLADANEQVRHAALNLARRLETPETDALLAELSRGNDKDLAAEAINVLGRRNSPSAPDMLTEIISKTKDPDLLAEVCRAMGRIGSSEFVQPLAKILMPGKKFFRFRRYPAKVRIAAAQAICRIPGEHSRIIIKALWRDPDARVREAVSVLYSQPGASKR